MITPNYIMRIGYCSYITKFVFFPNSVPFCKTKMQGMHATAFISHVKDMRLLLNVLIISQVVAQT